MSLMSMFPSMKTAKWQWSPLSVTIIANVSKGSDFDRLALICLGSIVGKVRNHQQTMAKLTCSGYFLSAEFSEQWLSGWIHMRVCVCVHVCSLSLTNKGHDIDVPLSAENYLFFALWPATHFSIYWHPLKEKLLWILAECLGKLWV